MQRKGRGASRRLGCIQLLPCKCKTAKTWTLGLWRHIYLQLVSSSERFLFLWIQVQAQFLYLHSFTDFSAWADTAAGFKPFWMSKSKQKHSLSTLSVFGVRAHSHVWECSAGQGISLVSKPHHTCGKIPQRKRKNHQTDWTGTYWSSVGELGLGVQSHALSPCLFCTKNKTAFRTTCAKGIQEVIQNWFQLSSSHSLYHPIPPFPITFCTAYLWTLFMFLSIYLMHSFSVNPLQTLTWKHQYTE